jgi:hypothetical protein
MPPHPPCGACLRCWDDIVGQIGVRGRLPRIVTSFKRHAMMYTNLCEVCPFRTKAARELWDARPPVQALYLAQKPMPLHFRNACVAPGVSDSRFIALVHAKSGSWQQAMDAYAHVVLNPGSDWTTRIVELLVNKQAFSEDDWAALT